MSDALQALTRLQKLHEGLLPGQTISFTREQLCELLGLMPVAEAGETLPAPRPAIGQTDSLSCEAAGRELGGLGRSTVRAWAHAGVFGDLGQPRRRHGYRIPLAQVREAKQRLDAGWRVVHGAWVSPSEARTEPTSGTPTLDPTRPVEPPIQAVAKETRPTRAPRKKAPAVPPLSHEALAAAIAAGQAMAPPRQASRAHGTRLLKEAILPRDHAPRRLAS